MKHPSGQHIDEDAPGLIKMSVCCQNSVNRSRRTVTALVAKSMDLTRKKTARPSYGTFTSVCSTKPLASWTRAGVGFRTTVSRSSFGKVTVRSGDRHRGQGSFEDRR